jgi:hypothetical protein
MRKSLANFIRENRAELDAAILGALYRYDGKGGRGTIPANHKTFNDSERRQWILNDEGLYNWARSEGVRL